MRPGFVFKLETRSMVGCSCPHRVGDSHASTAEAIAVGGSAYSRRKCQEFGSASIVTHSQITRPIRWFPVNFSQRFDNFLIVFFVRKQFSLTQFFLNSILRSPPSFLIYYQFVIYIFSSQIMVCVHLKTMKVVSFRC